MQISILILLSDEDLDSESSTKNNPAMQKRKRRSENSSDQDDDDLGARFAKLVKGSPNLGDFAEKLISWIQISSIITLRKSGKSGLLKPFQKDQKFGREILHLFCLKFWPVFLNNKNKIVFI